MASEQEERFVESVERFTHKNNRVVSEQDLAIVRRFIQSHYNGPKFAYQVLLERMKLNNSQSRLLAFDVLDYVFQRCSGVRQCVSQDIKLILQLTIGYGRSQKLPQPPQSAWKLRNTAIEAVKKWNKKFGNKYPQIRVAIYYLEKNLQMQFPQIAGAEELEQQRLQEQRKKQICTREYQKIDRIYEGYVQQIVGVQKQLEESIELLQQNQRKEKQGNVKQAVEEDDSFSWEEIDTQKGEQDPKVGINNYGSIWSPRNLTSSQQEELEAQKVLISNLQDIVKIVRKEHIPKIQKWLRIMSGAEVGSNSRNGVDPAKIQLQSRIRELVEIKSTIVHLQHQGKEILELFENSVPDETAEGPPQSDGKADDFDQILDTIQQCSKKLEKNKEDQNFDENQTNQDFHQHQSKQINDKDLQQQNLHENFEKTQISSKSLQNNLQDQIETESLQTSLQNGNQDEVEQKNLEDLQPIQKKKSCLAEEVKQKLLKEAPIFPAGFDPISAFQSSSQASLNPGALDIYNHWGPVDKDAHIQNRAYQQFFGYRTSYYKPPENKIQQQQGQKTSKKRKISANLENQAKLLKSTVEGGNLSGDARTQRELDRRYNRSILATNEEQEEEKTQQKDTSLTAKQRILKRIKNK